jgi:hypothetical protein
MLVMKVTAPKMVITYGVQIAIAISEPNEISAPGAALLSAETALAVLVARLDTDEFITESLSLSLSLPLSLSELDSGAAVTSIMSAAVALTLLQVAVPLPQVPPYTGAVVRVEVDMIQDMRLPVRE